MSKRKIRGDSGETDIAEMYDEIGYKNIQIVGKKGGATDIYSEYKGKKQLTSVKKRFFYRKTKETPIYVINGSHLEKLKKEAEEIKATPFFAFILKQDEISHTTIHTFIWELDEIPKLIKKSTRNKRNYSINFGEKHLNEFQTLIRRSKFHLFHVEESSTIKKIKLHGLMNL